MAQELRSKEEVERLLTQARVTLMRRMGLVGEPLRAEILACIERQNDLLCESRTLESQDTGAEISATKLLEAFMPEYGMCVFFRREEGFGYQYSQGGMTWRSLYGDPQSPMAPRKPITVEEALAVLKGHGWTTEERISFKFNGEK